MKRYVALARYASVPALFIASSVLAHAQTEDTTISGLVTSMTTGFGLIKTLILTVVTWFIGDEEGYF